jgi:hypothetical protein
MSLIGNSIVWALALGIGAIAPSLPPTAGAASPPAKNERICTTRITQLTGGYDPEGRICPNDTTQWRVAGVDLGANTEHKGKLYFFFGDVVPTGDGSWPPYDSDLIAYTQDSSPEPNGFRITPVIRDGAFYPFTVHIPSGSPLGIQLLRNDTPTGAFSYDGKVYVFFAWHDRSKPDQPFRSSLASSPDPSQPAPFEWVVDISTKFSQVAPWIIRNSEVTGLPSVNGDGLILFGQSATPDGHGGVFLAWMPLQPGMAPDLSNLQYYTNAPATGRRWTEKEAAAVKLFKTKWPWSSLSVGRVVEAGVWILLYQRTARPEAPEESIVARIAQRPWDFMDATEAREIPIFTPDNDGGYRKVAGDGTVLSPGFMHRENSPVADGLNRLPPVIGGDGFAYGAYLLNRYTRWDATTRKLTIYYLMSTGMPYQVQLMRSEIRIIE